ncbi:MAG TPA: flagellar protein FlaG [Chroococcales cyanobacterium]|jgi:flagellar protein FlaG
MKIEGVMAAAANVAPQIAANEGTSRAEREKNEQALNQNRSAQASPQNSNQPEVGHKLLAAAVAQIDKMLASFDDTLRISIHDQTKSVMVRIVNDKTGEVMREFPPEKFLDMVAAFQKQLAGLFVDERK